MWGRQQWSLLISGTLLSSCTTHQKSMQAITPCLYRVIWGPLVWHSVCYSHQPQVPLTAVQFDQMGHHEPQDKIATFASEFLSLLASPLSFSTLNPNMIYSPYLLFNLTQHIPSLFLLYQWLCTLASTGLSKKQTNKQTNKTGIEGKGCRGWVEVNKGVKMETKWDFSWGNGHTTMQCEDDILLSCTFETHIFWEPMSPPINSIFKKYRFSAPLPWLHKKHIWGLVWVLGCSNLSPMVLLPQGQQPLSCVVIVHDM